MIDNVLLVIMGMQNDFITGVRGTKDAQSIVSSVIEKAKNYKKTLYTMDTYHYDYRSTQDGQDFPTPHCVKNAYGYEIIDGLKNLSDTKFLLYKHTFGSAQLGEFVRQNFELGTINEVELVGAYAETDVVSNALTIKAFCPEIKITVDSACCAGTDRKSTRLNSSH